MNSHVLLKRDYIINICGVYPLPTYNISEIILIRANLGYSNEKPELSQGKVYTWKCITQSQLQNESIWALRTSNI